MNDLDKKIKEYRTYINEVLNEKIEIADFFIEFNPAYVRNDRLNGLLGDKGNDLPAYIFKNRLLEIKDLINRLDGNEFVDNIKDDLINELNQICNFFNEEIMKDMKLKGLFRKNFIDWVKSRNITLHQFSLLNAILR